MSDQSDIARRHVPGELFSMEAADNAEVVPPVPPPRGPDSMWSTSAPDHEANAVTAPTDVGTAEHDPWQRMGPSTPPPGAVPPFAAPSGSNGSPRAAGAHDAAHAADAPPDPWRTLPRDEPPPGVTGVFSAEPVDREDVVDNDEVLAELLEDEAAWPGRTSANPFATARPDTPPPPPPAAPADAWEDPWIEWYDAGAQDDVAPDRPAPAPTGPEHRDSYDHETEHPIPPPPFHDRSTGTGEVRADSTDHEHGRSGAAPSEDVRRSTAGTTSPIADDIVADQHGLDIAVARLAARDRETARVPLSVCGALLLPGEHVIGAVTGQMLGRPAAVVVTLGRVLIVNDRRWQPIVDVYQIDERLVVRGRHDRSMAALSVGDDERLSMVDGIHDVELAIELADAIRHPGAAEHGAPSAF